MIVQSSKRIPFGIGLSNKRQRPKVDQAAVDSLQLSGAAGKSYFPTDYYQARTQFRKSSQETIAKRPKAVEGSVPVENSENLDLTVDYLVIPATKEPKNLLFVSSGVHGSEGPAGSAAQELFIKEHLPEMDLSETTVVLLHAYNPWGYVHNHQYTENNVDTNRNNLKDPDMFEDYPVGDYGLVAGWMSAKSSPSATYLGTQMSATIGMARSLWSASGEKRRVVNALGEGQAEDSRGVRFVGTESLPQRKPVFDALKPYLEQADRIVHFDIHTGLGDDGVLQMIDMSEKDSLGESEDLGLELEKGGIPYSSGVLPGFYDSSLGDFTNNSEMLAKEGAKVLTYTAEIGTLGSSIGAQLGTVFRLKERGQLDFFKDEVSDGKKEAILNRYTELFNPQDAEWQESVIKQFRFAFGKTLDFFSKK